MTELQMKKLDGGREYRNLELRTKPAEEEKSEYRVEGYASTFNEPYCLYREKDLRVMEQVDPHAFDECDMSDVIFQYNHEGRVFARTRNNTLSVTADEKGLFISADLSGTEAGRSLWTEIHGGYTDRMSFGFTVTGDKWTETTDRESGEVVATRTITRIGKLFDVSAVSIPANDMTSISARSVVDGEIAKLEAERLRAEKRKKLLLLLEVTK